MLNVMFEQKEYDVNINLVEVICFAYFNFSNFLNSSKTKDSRIITIISNDMIF